MLIGTVWSWPCSMTLSQRSQKPLPRGTWIIKRKHTQHGSWARLSPSSPGKLCGCVEIPNVSFAACCPQTGEGQQRLRISFLDLLLQSLRRSILLQLIDVIHIYVSSFPFCGTMAVICRDYPKPGKPQCLAAQPKKRRCSVSRLTSSFTR